MEKNLYNRANLKKGKAMRVLYIHGFGGCGMGKKATLFKEYYKEKGKKFFAPSLSYIPKLALQTLCDFIELNDRKVNLIGSSLGGFYASYLANRYKLKAVLINPSTKPWETLKRYIGLTQNYCDGSRFEWKREYLEDLKKFDVSNPIGDQFMVLLQTGDKDLDYRIAADKFCKANVIIEEGGSHSFEGIERHFENIENFFNAL